MADRYVVREGKVRGEGRRWVLKCIADSEDTEPYFAKSSKVDRRKWTGSLRKAWHFDTERQARARIAAERFALECVAPVPVRPVRPRSDAARIISALNAVRLMRERFERSDLETSGAAGIARQWIDVIEKELLGPARLDAEGTAPAPTKFDDAVRGLLQAFHLHSHYPLRYRCNVGAVTAAITAMRPDIGELFLVGEAAGELRKRFYPEASDEAEGTAADDVRGVLLDGLELARAVKAWRAESAEHRLWIASHLREIETTQDTLGRRVVDAALALLKAAAVADAPKSETFEEAWGRMEAIGYQYGSDALEQVRFGWELASGKVRP